MKIAKRIDAALCDDMGICISDIPMVLKHVSKVSRLVKGFVFAYIENDLIHYDEVELITECNGFRLRHPKFLMSKLTYERLYKRKYQRWYVRGEQTLYPLQISKPQVFEDSFYIAIDDNPNRKTKIAYVGETPFIRKKPLVACRRCVPGWGVLLNVKLKDTA